MTTEIPGAPGTQRPGSPLQVVLAWAVVTIPALWGISMTARTSMALFKESPPAVTAPPGAGAQHGPKTSK